MKYFSYLHTAVSICTAYHGREPFHLFIKDFFRQHKKHGSSDRRQITHLCYCGLRLGVSLPELPPEEKILAGLFLCSSQPNEMLSQLKPVWNAATGLTLAEKCRLLDILPRQLTPFPAPEAVTAAIDLPAFQLSHLTQPEVFLRARPGCLSSVTVKLKNAGIPFSLPATNTIAVPGNTKAESVLDINREYVVQDYSSQRTGELMQLIQLSGNKVWDCCAASGGKSILAKDILGDIDLTVSDIRKQVLINLETRFKQAGIQRYRLMQLDLSRPATGITPGSFGLVIADVPCTGSGTWARTPERLSYFDNAEIDRYSDLQKKILLNAWPFIQPNGYLLYITCSVFKSENEDAVDFMLKQFPAELIKMEIFKGYDEKADTLFGALIKKKG